VNQLGDLHQEIIALAHCREAEEFVAATEAQACEESIKRQDLVRSVKSLDDILNQLLTDSQRLNAILRGIS
jgi:hypothetical protein